MSAGSPWWVDDVAGEESQPLVSSRVVVGLIVLTIVLLTGYLVLGRALGPNPAPTTGYVPPSLGGLPTPSPSTSTAPGASASLPSTPTPPRAATVVALASWLSSSGQPLSAEFKALVVRAQADVDDRDLNGLRQECVRLAEVAAEMDTSPPPGDATDVANAWQQAAGLAGGAAADCAKAIQTQSPELLSTAVAQTRSAAAYLTLAITTAEALTG